MNRARKTDLLYKRAKGQVLEVSPEEMMELRRYKVSVNEGEFYATKSNISAYIQAVDQGYKYSFYDWCMSNDKADRRRKGSGKKEMRHADREKSLASMLFGWLTWGLAIYWMFHETLSVELCAIAGMVVAFILFQRARKWALFTLVLLPVALAVFFAG